MSPHRNDLLQQRNPFTNKIKSFQFKNRHCTFTRNFLTIHMSIELIKQNFNTATEVLNNFMGQKDIWQKMKDAGNIMAEAIKSDHKIISCGNGGSMSDAMHFAEELTGRFRNDRPGMAAISISDPSHITCVGNDYGFDYIFSRFVESMGQSGDVLLGISTSGNSPNIINAVNAAKQKGMKTIVLTGKTGGELSKIADIELRVPYNDFSDRIQEVHIKIIHSLIHYIEVITT